MHKKVNVVISYTLLYLFLIIIFSYDILADEGKKTSLFDNFSKFFQSIFKEEKSPAKDVDMLRNEVTEHIKLIEIEELQSIVNSSDCLKQLPEHALINLNIFDYSENINEFVISNDLKIQVDTGQKTDITIFLSLKKVLLMRNSTSIDGKLKEIIGSEDMEIEYSWFKALKYRNVLSCIENSEITIEQPKEEIKPEELQEKGNITNKNQENFSLTDGEHIQKPRMMIIREDLFSKKLKYLFDDFNNGVEYTLVADNISDYSNLRVSKLLSNWNYAIETVDFDSIEDSEKFISKNIILVSYPCGNKISNLLMEQEECKNAVKENKGVIKFYNDNDRRILVLIGSSGDNLVDTALTMANYEIFDFNESDILVITNEMYNTIFLQRKLNEVKDDLRSIYKKSEDYQSLISDKEFFKVFHYHPGQWFRDMHEGIYKENSVYKLSEKEREGVNRYDFGELAKKGDDVMEQRSLVKNGIKSLQNQIGTGTLYRKFDKKSLNSETLKEFESKLATAQKSFDDLSKGYEKLVNMTEEIERKALDIQYMTNYR